MSILAACLTSQRRAIRHRYRKHLRQGRANSHQCLLLGGKPSLFHPAPCLAYSIPAGRLLLGEGLRLGPWKALGLPVSPLVLLPLQIYLLSSLHLGCQLHCKSFLLPPHSVPLFVVSVSIPQGGSPGRWNRSEKEVMMGLQSPSLGVVQCCLCLPPPLHVGPFSLAFLTLLCCVPSLTRPEVGSWEKSWLLPNTLIFCPSLGLLQVQAVLTVWPS